MERTWTGLAALAITLVAACSRPAEAGPGAMPPDAERFAVRFQGRVLDAEGQPVDVPVRVHYSGEIRGDGVRLLNVDGNVHAEPAQAFDEMRWWATSQMAKASTALVGELQASDVFGLYEPSPPRPIEVQSGTTLGGYLRLGARRPTVPVRVVDSAGKPVTRYWLLALTEEEPAPCRFGEFTDGVAELPIPRASFRIKANLQHGARQTIAGPFEPAALPARIDITLPD